MPKHPSESPDLTKLPQWAQQHIALLERRLTETQTALEGYQQGHTGSSICYDAHTTPVHLPEGVTVRFSWGLHAWAAVRLADKEGDSRQALVIHTSEPAIIAMHSSNLFGVDLDNRYDLREDAGIRDMGQALLRKAKSAGLWFEDLHRLIDIAPRDEAGRKQLESDARAAQRARGRRSRAEPSR